MPVERGRYGELASTVDRRGFLRAGAAVGLAGAAGCVGGLTGGGEEYPSEDIRVLTGGSGSLFDFWARAYAEFLPDHMDTNFVVENIAGGGGTAFASRTYNADPDGYTIGNFNIPGQRAGQLTLDVDYDLNEIAWLGRAANYPYTLFVSPDSEFESLEDLQNANRELLVPDPGIGSTSSLVAVIANEVFGIDNWSFVTGFGSGVEALQAVVRGDGDIRYQIGEPIVDMVEAGEVRPIIALLEESPQYAPDVMNLSDIGEESLANFALQAFFGAPPGIEDSQLTALQSAFEDASTSSEMEQWAEENPPLGRGFSYADGATCAEIIGGVEEDINEYSDLIEEKFNQ